MHGDDAFILLLGAAAAAAWTFFLPLLCLANLTLSSAASSGGARQDPDAGSIVKRLYRLSHSLQLGAFMACLLGLHAS